MSSCMFFILSFSVLAVVIFHLFVEASLTTANYDFERVTQ